MSISILGLIQIHILGSTVSSELSYLPLNQVVVRVASKLHSSSTFLVFRVQLLESLNCFYTGELECRFKTSHSFDDMLRALVHPFVHRQSPSALLLIAFDFRFISRASWAVFIPIFTLKHSFCSSQ